MEIWKTHLCPSMDSAFMTLLRKVSLSPIIPCAHSLESLMEGHNWFLNQFVKIPRRSIIVYFSSLLAKACLKGHGNEADFLGFLQKLGLHRSLTLPFELFRFWLRIRGDIRNRKTTPRLAESGSWWLSDLASRGVGFWMFKRKTWRVGESATPWVG